MLLLKGVAITSTIPASIYLPSKAAWGHSTVTGTYRGIHHIWLLRVRVRNYSRTSVCGML